MRFSRKNLVLDVSDRDVVVAQHAALSRQIPILYLILAINTVGVAGGFVGKAPQAMTIGVPALIVIACLMRAAHWMNVQSVETPFDEAVLRLRRTQTMAAVFAIAFVIWVTALYPYGDALSHSLIAFFVGFTAFASLFLMVNLPSGALTVTALIIPPFSIFLMSQGEPSFVAMGIDLMLSTAAFMIAQMRYSADFAALVRARIDTQKLDAENKRLANLDSLTNLPNRRQFFARIDAAIARRAGKPGGLYVGVVDLDGFKPINDIYGHALGDRLLTEAARRLEVYGSPNVFIARLGGDEFGVVVEEQTSERAVMGLCADICLALREPFDLHDVNAKISGSLGLAVFRGDDHTLALYEQADYALHDAKQNHRGEAVLFTAEQQSSMRRLSYLEQALRAADLDSALYLKFQPIVSTQTGAPVAFETLARWRDPQHGEVSPDVFIRIAEKTELMNDITEVLLRKALEAAKDWPDFVSVSFNLSVRDITSPQATLRIIQIVRDSGIAAHRVEFEVTETALISDVEQARESLIALKALGVKISLDDFGTGYSSLNYMLQLPFDKIKIDRAFVRDVAEPGMAADIVRSVIDLCRNLKLDSVVEGVETEDQKRVLHSLGCTAMQGYFFAKPMPEHEAKELAGQAAKAA
ncbi:MAG: EAL domain-containing protein [Hyphomicrobiales bacterium]|nr:EAL domain-containing protein [Hyphomicrobiales bacterium]